MIDPLVVLAANLFDQRLGSMSGAPYSELHDVMDPDAVIRAVADEVAAALGTAVLPSARDEIVGLVIDQYEDEYSVA